MQVARAGKSSRGVEACEALEVCARWPEGSVMGWSLGKGKCVCVCVGGGPEESEVWGFSTRLSWMAA